MANNLSVQTANSTSIKCTLSLVRLNKDKDITAFVTNSRCNLMFKIERKKKISINLTKLFRKINNIRSFISARK